jgi:hypothetical protein
MRAALNLHTAPSSISANSPTPIRASRNIPGFPFSLATVLRKDRSDGHSNGAHLAPYTVLGFRPMVPSILATAAAHFSTRAGKSSASTRRSSSEKMPTGSVSPLAPPTFLMSFAALIARWLPRPTPLLRSASQPALTETSAFSQPATPHRRPLPMASAR